MKKMGFSLVELLVVVAIFSVISAAVVAALLSAQHSWSTGSAQAMVTAELRRVLDRMSRELVEGKSSELQGLPADGRWYQTLTFRVPQDRSVPPDGSVLDANGNIAEWSDWITYRAAMVQRRTPSIVREVAPAGGAALPPEVLAHHVANLLFRRQNVTPSVVEISVTAFSVTDAGHYTPRTMGTRVQLRNG